MRSVCIHNKKMKACHLDLESIMLNISQKKINTIQSHLYGKSKKKTRETGPYREQADDFQRVRMGMKGKKKKENQLRA